jgi:23S rRNA (adenine2503-C2)-methyltransferase
VPRGREFARRRPLGRRIAAAVEDRFDLTRLEVVERAEDPADGFVKYLLRSPDGALSEAVRIPLHRPGRFTVCLSSQVGCAQACTFCATGRLGLARNLGAAEMVDAFLRVRDEAPGRVTGAVFMGQGEPFANYDAVIRAARVLSHPCGGQVRGDAITISTVGIVPAIRRYARERHPFRLIVSLTSADPAKRAALLPVASRWSLEEVADAIREYAAVAPGLVTVAWVLLGGVNDGPEEAEALRRLLGDLPLRVNLVDVNDPRPGGFRRSTDDERRAFVHALQVLRAPVVRRYSGGANRHAACGMLAATRWEAPAAP